MIDNSGGYTEALAGPVLSPAGGEHRPATRALTVHERFELLFDPGSQLDGRPYLQEEPGASSWPLLTAVGRVNGMAVCAIAQDAESLDTSHWRQIQLAIGFACDRNLPLVAIFDGSPTRLSGGLQAWSALAGSAGSAALCPAPKVALVFGENTGPSALLASLFDVVVMARGESSLTLTDASITNRITNACVQEVELGGWKVHASRTGLADLVCDNEVLGLRSIRRLLQYSAESMGWTWPSSQALSYCPSLDTLIPDEVSESYDVHELLREISDTRSFLELGAEAAQSLVVGFAPVAGRAVGLIASQNKDLAGVLDIPGCRKAVRHLRLCQAMGVPVVTFVDVPGFLPGQEQEAGGLAIEAAQLLRTYAQTRVPKITIVVDKALGAAGVALGSRATIPDKMVAWHGASMGLMAAHHAGLDTGRGVRDADDAMGGVDAVIEPGETRRWLGEAVTSLCQLPERRI